MSVKNRVSDKAKSRYKKRISDIVSKGLSRNVTIYLQTSKSQCPNCYFDKLTNRSSGKCCWTPLQAINKQSDWEAQGGQTVRYKYFLRGRCPVCRGLGYLELQRRTCIPCLVIWDPQNRGFGNTVTYTPAGSEGSTVCQLKTDVKYFNTFKNCTKVIVDGIECKLSRSPIKRGLGNEAVLVITAFTDEKPDIDRDEIRKDYRENY